MVRRCVASRIADGWSNTSVAGSRRPVAAARRLRSSTAVSESTPRSRNAVSTGTESAEGWPSTTATVVRTRSVSSRSASGVVSAASFRANAGRSAAAAPVLRRRFAATRPRSSGGTSESDRTEVSRATATTSASSRTSPASKRARPSAVVRAPTPERCIRSRPDAAPLSRHRPHAIDRAGRPRARRCWARPSRKALAAA